MIDSNDFFGRVILDLLDADLDLILYGGMAAVIHGVERTTLDVVFTFIHPQDAFLHLGVFIMPELRYEALLPHSEILDFHGRSLRVLSAKHLLRLKQAIGPPRAKDEMDIAELKKVLEREDD